jgi:uncharacterized protein CbrC (UPF0167 family)
MPRLEIIEQACRNVMWPAIFARKILERINVAGIQTCFNNLHCLNLTLNVIF